MYDGAQVGRQFVPRAQLTNSKEEAFKTGNWEWHERMMDALISALESSKVGFK